VIGWIVLPLALLAGGSPASTVHTVEIRGMAFHPAELTVAPGDTVVWVNLDIVPHTATAPANALETGLLQHGQLGRYVPGRAGKISYVCALHPIMRGALTVKR
jgi:plastocyanin